MQNNTKKIDVSKIYNGEVTEIPFEFDIVPENTELLDLEFKKPVKVSGRVYEKAHGKNKAESYVELVFDVEGEFNTHCARCAKELCESFKYSKVYGLSKKLASESDEFIEVPDGLLDIQELAESVFYLELPSRVLCKEDCKGLCVVCGIDLNENDCSCKRNIGANTLEDLKKLLDK